MLTKYIFDFVSLPIRLNYYHPLKLCHTPALLCFE